MIHKCFKSVSKVLWEWFQSVCQSQCFKVICLHRSHRSYPSIRRACFFFLTESVVGPILFWPTKFRFKKFLDQHFFGSKCLNFGTLYNTPAPPPPVPQLLLSNVKNCHNPKSTPKKPKRNSTELSLTRLWLCTPPPQYPQTPTPTHHNTLPTQHPPTQTQLQSKAASDQHIMLSKQQYKHQGQKNQQH